MDYYRNEAVEQALHMQFEKARRLLKEIEAVNKNRERYLHGEA